MLTKKELETLIELLNAELSSRRVPGLSNKAYDRDIQKLHNLRNKLVMMRSAR